MMQLSKLNGDRLEVDPDQVLRAEATPETMLTLMGGKKVLVLESIDEVMQLAIASRACILASTRLQTDGYQNATVHHLPGDTCDNC